MAIAATHLALIHFFSYADPRIATRHHIANAMFLVKLMIHLKNDWIRLATIDTWMHLEEFKDCLLCFIAKFSPPTHRDFAMLESIVLIIEARPLTTTLHANAA